MEEKEKKEVVKKKRVTRKKKEEVIDNIEEKEENVKEIIVEKKSGFNYAEVIVIMIIMLIIGGITGSFFTYITKDNRVINKIVKSDVPEEMNEFLNTYNDIINNYYEEVDHKKLLEAGINGMLSYLDDDYSVYMDPDTSKSFTEQVEGKYKGIGVEIVLKGNGDVVIYRVFSDSPAEKAGLKENDKFLKVDGIDVTEKNASDIASMIREPGKSEVQIVIERDNEELTFDISLSEVNIDNVTGKIIEVNNKKIGYINISLFASNTYEQFKKVLLNLEKDNIDSLIIDVRGNSGGYLTVVTDIVSLFLDKSKVVYQLDTKGVVEQIYSKTNESRKYKIAVLIDTGSASASEILAGALKESYGAILVGTNSYGKGTVQAAYQLSSGSTVKYTIQKWLTPNGNWIDKVGLKPDYAELLGNEYISDPCDENDTQLQKALKELSK